MAGRLVSTCLNTSRHVLPLILIIVQIVNPRPEGGQSQEFAEERDEEEEKREVEAAYSQSILALSAGVVEKTLEPASYSLQLLQPDQQMERTVVTDSQLETYMSGLVDIFLVDRLVEDSCGTTD